VDALYASSLLAARKILGNLSDGDPYVIVGKNVELRNMVDPPIDNIHLGRTTVMNVVPTSIVNKSAWIFARELKEGNVNGEDYKYWMDIMPYIKLLHDKKWKNRVEWLLSFLKEEHSLPLIETLRHLLQPVIEVCNYL
jgi:hypothetical protein